MKTTEYLYDCNPSEFSAMPYESALYYKLEKAKVLIYSLMESDFMSRDDERVAAVFEVIKFNNKLLAEIKDQQ